MSFIIVKNTGTTWAHYFEKDPKLGKVHISYLASNTNTGKSLNIKEKYEDKKKLI